MYKVNYSGGTSLCEQFSTVVFTEHALLAIAKFLV